jgi:hypothetical protein
VELVDKMGGHEEHFITAPDDDFICPICLSVSLDAVAHECGKLYCDSCWRQWSSQGKVCPTCQRGGDAPPAHRDRRSILNLEIRCPRSACEESFRLGDKVKHMDTECSHRLTKCSLCEADTTIAALDEHSKTECHFRDTTCPDCAVPVVYADLSQHLETECPLRSSHCPLCREVVQQADLARHMQENAGSHILALVVENQSLKVRVAQLEQAAEASAADQVPHQNSNSLASEAEVATSTVTGEPWHPGRIGAAPNGISRVDPDEDIMWSSEVGKECEGYTWDTFKQGWCSSISTVYRPTSEDDCRWTCCNGMYDSPPCGLR